MPGPFTSPVAFSVPFDNAANGFVAQDVQTAIEEAKGAAFENDRYPMLATYTGNANVGRYLETFPSLAMNNAPFIFPENSKIVTVSLGSVAATTGTVGFFKLTDLVTPVASFSLTAQSRALFTLQNVPFNALEELAIRVTAGSFNKPFLHIWINTST